MLLSEIVETMSIRPHELDKMFNEIASVQETLQNHAAVFKEKTGKDDIFNPFEKTYDLEKFLKDLRNNLLYFLKNEMTKNMQNIPINMESFTADYTNNFGIVLNAEVAASMLYEQYIVPGRSLAYNDILRKAKRLLPRRIEQNQPGEKLDLILSNITLKLTVALDTFLEPVIDSASRDNIIAFDRLIAIIIDREPAESAKPEGLSDLILKRKNVVGTYSCNLKHVSQVRIFKNQKMHVTFKSQDRALKIAKALI